MVCVFWNEVHTDASGSSKVVDFDINQSMYGTSYWSSIVALVLSSPVSEILSYCIYAETRKPPFLYPTPIPATISGCLLWSRPMMFRSTWRRNPRL